MTTDPALDGWIFALLADAVGVSHALVVAFVVGVQVAVLAGWAFKWGWTQNQILRRTHLGAIAFITAIDGLGFLCPLTRLEYELRQRAGEGAYAGGFIQHWLERLLYYQWPGWVFTALYVGFAAMVVATYIYYPPKKNKKEK